jgi:GAF domain-containing protein
MGETEFIEIAQRANGLIAAGRERHEVLKYLATAVEEVIPHEIVASILVLEDGVLRNGASPRLPEDYLKAIDRIRPDERVGTCAAAAATGRVVVTKDFRADDKWSELRHLPMALGFVGAWSTPIKDAAGRVLGTFGIYNRTSREPDPVELEGMALLAQTAASVLTKKAHLVG